MLFHLGDWIEMLAGRYGTGVCKEEPRTLQNYLLPWMALMAADIVISLVKTPFPNPGTYLMANILFGWNLAHLFSGLLEWWGVHLVAFLVLEAWTTWLLFLFSRWLCRLPLKKLSRWPQTIYVVEAVLCAVYWTL